MPHARIGTRQMYLDANMQLKEKALERVIATDARLGHRRPVRAVVCDLAGVVQKQFGSPIRSPCLTPWQGVQHLNSSKNCACAAFGRSYQDGESFMLSTGSVDTHALHLCPRLREGMRRHSCQLRPGGRSSV